MSLLPRTTSPLLATILVAASLVSAASADALERQWTTGVSPVSWGFAVTPPREAREVRLSATSSSVELLSVHGGPGLPADWSVEITGPRTAVASGPSPIVGGVERPSFLVVETNRSSADIGSRGVRPVEWEVRFGDSPGSAAASPAIARTFEPVLELSDAVSRGLVLATIEPLSPWGPAEVTVDNPTWEPLWLDLRPGSVVRVGRTDWVIGLVKPFRMMRKQKTGRTIDAFPLVPVAGPADTPRRTGFSSRPGEHEALLAEAGIAVRRLRERTASGARRPGRFEASQPFEFWPLLLKWSVWNETCSPPREVLVGLVSGLLDRARAAGDTYAAAVGPAEAAAEIEALLPALEAIRQDVRTERLPLDLEASRARFH